MTQKARLVPGLMKAHLPKNEMCCDWLAVPMRFIGELCFSATMPLTKAVLLYPENIEHEDRAEPLHARILQDIKVETLLCFFFFWLNHVLYGISTTV